MERIMKIVDAIGSALEDLNYPSGTVPGSEEAAPSTIDEVKDFADIFAGDYGLIIARVKAMINAILSQFTTASEARRSAELRDMPLSGGLHLFLGSSGEPIEMKPFLKTNTLVLSKSPLKYL